MTRKTDYHSSCPMTRKTDYDTSQLKLDTLFLIVWFVVLCPLQLYELHEVKVYPSCLASQGFLNDHHVAFVLLPTLSAHRTLGLTQCLIFCRVDNTNPVQNIPLTILWTDLKSVSVQFPFQNAPLTLPSRTWSIFSLLKKHKAIPDYFSSQSSVRLMK